METSVQRLLQDKFYDKRKAGALELESAIRAALAENNQDRITKIVWQLCHEYAYAVHQPHARNGGLIGLAAAAIALGADVARHLKEIVPPVLACFSDQDARVRYYACESMYNIAKVAKGEILVYFNDVFDALSKLAADTELSVKNGAELLDRLVKDIVSESAASYASVLVPDAPPAESQDFSLDQSMVIPHAFSLPRFIPLLQERINVTNPFARTFLVSWITLLDQIPDLELVSYLPSFLGGLLRFLGDTNEDVHTTTKTALDRFLVEIKKIAAVKKEIAESRKSRDNTPRKPSDNSSWAGESQHSQEVDTDAVIDREGNDDIEQVATAPTIATGEEDPADGASSLTAAEDGYAEAGVVDDEWIPGQDAQIDYQRILDILVTFLAESRQEEIQVTTLKWIETFMEICPEDILSLTPKLLNQLLPALSHDKNHVSQAANRVNQLLISHIMALPDDPTRSNGGTTAIGGEIAQIASTNAPTGSSLRPPKEGVSNDKRESLGVSKSTTRKPPTPEDLEDGASRPSQVSTPEPPIPNDDTGDMTAENALHVPDLDYEAAVSALTLQFLHEHEATRVAALAWLIMLHRKSPRKILAIQDATFPALLKTLSDPAEAVVTRDLLLLSQISKSSDDSYFTSFMVNLLKLFCTDRRLLETRGNLIIRQLCLSLSAERIYRTMADCLEREEDDVEFASIMVQNLNNNLITAPELADLRKRLRNLDSRDGQTFFTVLFKAWCVNSVATFSLCLLAQAYEQAYNLLQIFCEIEMTVNMLIQIDKLVQLLESPVFTYLRMQLLEPERHPNLYKCMYGLLMLLPQSSAFAALKNRLNSVSAIGYLHIGTRGAPPATPSSVSTFERQNRLKSREEGGIKWTELLEKFRATQEKVRRGQQRALIKSHGLEDPQSSPPGPARREGRTSLGLANPASANLDKPTGRYSPAAGAQRGNQQGSAAGGVGHSKGKSSLGNLGRFTGGVARGVTGAGKGKK
ncbi:related to vacuole-associated enzyme activator complex component (Vac14) [Ramularia collo-cygni]|uniref:Related to vacuole-associated enzyme activator complex component (Vac14) n=1 Tax=Ramularia collo-cygni TaxID=112498 RepID=A0A2D3URQ4_9PEZI|nr:related to vacuole-associated enzyme activator complex component (Vac14) [Ramularia collo-cygni]CZT14177.1 related to vacuole-associated enzyme activator complex component (Vac14) [Ramularia collo-cygni]